MKPYSLDLRQKIVDAYAVGDVSQRKLSKNFSVTLKFVSKLLIQYREFGTIGPKIRTEQTPIKLTLEQLEILRRLVEEQPDATLGELQARLQEKTDVLISISTMDRMVRLHLNLTFKKKVSTRPKREPIRSNLPDLNTGN